MNATATAALNLNDLETFVLVGKLGSFSAAAKQLSVPKSTVSRRVKRLEDSLGAALIVRGARQATLTETGAQLHARTAPALQEIADVQRGLVSTTVSGTLRLTAPHDMGTSRWFVSLLRQFREAYPDVRLDLDLTSRYVDMVQEGFDIALRAGPLEDSPAGLMSKRITVESVPWIFASPGYLAEHGEPMTPAELVEHEGVTIAPFRDGWPLVRDGETVLGRPKIVITARDFGFVAQAVAAGMGIGALPPFVADKLVHEGRLVTILKEWTTPLTQMNVVWPASRYVAPRVRAFLDLLTEEMPNLISMSGPAD